LVLRRGGALLFLLLAAFLNINPLLGFTSGLAASSVLSAYLVVRRNKPTVSTERTCRARELIGLARPYWINSLGTQARNLDALVVAMILNPVSAGYYGAASRLTTPLRIIPTSFASVLMPAASRSSLENKRSLIKVTAKMAGFTSLLYLALAVLLPFVVPVLLGNEFDEAIPVIQIVCGGLVFAAVASQFNALMQGWGYVRAVASISSATTVICLGGIALLSPILGVNGAGLALAFSYAIQVLVQVTYMYSLSRRGDNAGGIC
jgi:O-antigen/teichoic acid export membrane protein